MLLLVLAGGPPAGEPEPAGKTLRIGVDLLNPARTAITCNAMGLPAARLGFDPSGDTTNRVLSIFEAPGPDPSAAWRLAGTVDYSAALPY
jgi:hypothetical protein